MYELLVNGTVAGKLSEEDLDSSESYSVIHFSLRQMCPFLPIFSSINFNNFL